MSLQTLGMSGPYRCFRETLAAGVFVLPSLMPHLPELLHFHTLNSFNQQINKQIQAKVTGDKNVKPQHLLYLGALQFPRVTPPIRAIPGAAKVRALQIRKMEHLKVLTSGYKARAGFVLLGRKGKMFWSSLSRLKSKTFTRLRSKKACR